MITLFEHNRTAYEAAKAMLRETGKAAVVHPTGTGKSFIAFKFSEDNPRKQLLWISPSEYIFRTQLENLRDASGYEPNNIVFRTYARLMNMSREEMEELEPDLIVLDEFHRGGAAVWGASLARLLRLYPGVPLLGLSATSVRYLDNRRDMADELFDGCVASEMTLGEAISRGILNPPRYVTAVYSYRKSLERYRSKVLSLRGRDRRDRAEQLLEALRRALENADGLDVIFQKYMTDPHGKYIVFCSGKEHMDEMMEHREEWFRLVDRAPRVYSVYSEDPGAGAEFDAFKRDDRDDHLRLLYCIDVLNEGIHVGNVSGVILLRPTVSPIIYKQQIGRALSAGGTGEPVIFDIVDNIAGLCSIDAIRDEMQEFQRYNLLSGRPDPIIHERFRLTDAAGDSRRLFEELEGVLSSSWEYMYREAKAYYEEYGDLLPPQDYVTENGLKLGKWVVTQRICYRNGTGISPSRIERLERIGMSWQTLRERQWEEKFRLAEAYRETHGDLLPTRETAPVLTYWLTRQRQKQRDGLLSDEQFDRLSGLDMVWEADDAWESKFKLAEAFYRDHGNLDIPASYVAEDGTRLGVWYHTARARRRNGTLSEERARRLESIGMRWEPARERTWEQYYERAEEYYLEHGDLNVHADYETRDGMKLGAWIAGQRYGLKKGTLSEERRERLDGIGMSWQRCENRWNLAYSHARAYADVRGALDPPAEYRTGDGFPLGRWVASQRARYAEGKLEPSRVRRLEAIHIVWDASEEAWERGYAHARAYREANGDLGAGGRYEAEDGYKLGAWLANQRTRNREGVLTEEQRHRLDELGMTWSARTDRWKTGYEHLRDYRERSGDALVPGKYVCGDGYRLGSWMAAQRRAYRDGRLTAERRRLLEELGMVWNVNTDKWDRGYRYARSYRRDGCVVPIPQTYVTVDGYALGEWIRSQERQYRQGALGSEKVKRLAEIGVVFDVT